MIQTPLEIGRSHLLSQDTAGPTNAFMPPWQIKLRIDHLLDYYFAPENLTAHLDDYPQQLTHPHARPWQSIDWSSMEQAQILGLPPELFLAILTGIIDTEAPIRGYTQASRQYLEPIDPPLARMVGGITDADSNMIELGLWEKEERRHGPALMKAYSQLTGRTYTPHPKRTKPYAPSDRPTADLYHHGLHRILTEYSAACLYLWLATLTTGSLQQLLLEILQDEVNHMTKFWGAGRWLYPDSFPAQVRQWFSQGFLRPIAPSGTSWKTLTKLTKTYHRMTQILYWQDWHLVHQVQFVYATIGALQRLWCWNQTLTFDYLQQQLGDRPAIVSHKQLL